MTQKCCLAKYLVVYPPEMGEVYRCEGGQNTRVERREYKMGEGGERGGASSNLSGRASSRAARGVLEVAAISSHNIFVIVINEK